eukprot:scaffold24721_cov51-Phaeocystis_antarctica.AAC.2
MNPPNTSPVLSSDTLLATQHVHLEGYVYQVIPSYARLHCWTALGLHSSNALAMGIDSIAKRLFRQFALPCQPQPLRSGTSRYCLALLLASGLLSCQLPLSIAPSLQVLPHRPTQGDIFKSWPTHQVTGLAQPLGLLRQLFGCKT